MNFAVVEFKDSKQKLRKIVSIEYIRNADNSPFVPKSAKHFNRDSIYKVKWQEQSTSDGDSDWDGYCESSILCIAGSVESAKAKALELGVKLTGQCVLEHRSPKGSEDKDSRIGTDNDDNKIPGTRSRRSRDSTSSSNRKSEGDDQAKDKGANISNKESTSQSDNSKKNAANISQKKTGKQDAPIKSDELKKRKKDNNVTKATTIPPKKLKTTSDREAKLDVQNGVKKGPSNNLAKDFPAHERLRKALDNAHKNPLVTKQNGSRGEANHGEDKAASQMRCSSDESVKGKSMTIQESDEEVDSQILLCSAQGDVSWRDVPCPSSWPAFSEKNVGNGNESQHSYDADDNVDDVVTLALELQKCKGKLKESEDKHLITKASLRVVDGTRLKLQKELEDLKIKYQNKKKEVSSLNTLIESIHRSTRPGTNIKSFELPAVKPVSRSLMVDFDSSQTKQPSGVTKSKGSPHLQESRTSSTPVSKNITSTAEDAIGFRTPSGSGQKPKSVDFTPSPMLQNKKGAHESHKGKLMKDLNLSDINTVCKNTIKFINNEAVFDLNKDNEIDLGLKVTVNPQSLRENFHDNMGKIDKFSKRAAGLVWSKLDLSERSLLGSQSNRFKNSAPRQKATPEKISACIGFTRAMLILNGQPDIDTDLMLGNLMAARRGISSKFNQESTAIKRKVPPIPGPKDQAAGYQPEETAEGNEIKQEKEKEDKEDTSSDEDNSSQD